MGRAATAYAKVLIRGEYDPPSRTEGRDRQTVASIYLYKFILGIIMVVYYSIDISISLENQRRVNYAANGNNRAR